MPSLARRCSLFDALLLVKEKETSKFHGGACPDPALVHPAAHSRAVLGLEPTPSLQRTGRCALCTRTYNLSTRGYCGTSRSSSLMPGC
jgi:hypothetical protein